MKFIAKVVNVNEYKNKVLELVKTYWNDYILKQHYNLKFEFDDSLFNSPYTQTNAIGIVVEDQDKDNKLAGFYFGVIAPYHFNKKVRMAQEIGWGIHQDYQKTRAVVVLLDHINEVMENMKIDFWNLNLQNTPEYQRAGKYLASLGYVHAYNIYFKRGY